MKLQMKKNLLTELWDDAVQCRKWDMEETLKGNREGSKLWNGMFLKNIEFLAQITTESYSSLYDMVSKEAQDMLEEKAKARQELEEILERA